ncbi:MAG: spore germination protein [Clostridiales bacterium]|nr:spore germination protein [Clostridiales bacterium]
MKLFSNLDQNIEYMKSRFPVDQSFDMIGRNIAIGEQNGYLLFIDGFAKDDVMVHVMRAIQTCENKTKNNVSYLIDTIIPYLEADAVDRFDQLESALLAGSLLLLIEGEDKAIVIDARQYPARNPEESDIERVAGGSKDSFVETIVFNTALIRRRVRDRNLTFEMKSVGRASKTDVCLGYIKGRADEKFVEQLRRKIESIDVDSLIMAEKSLEELLLKKHWFNPLPQMKYTQRPDSAASYLYEGHVLILVDTAPSVMVTPATLFYYMQFAEDYNREPIVGTYYKLARFLAAFTALFLTPTWLLLAENNHSLPEIFRFIGVKEEIGIPLLIQFLILEFGFDILKMSATHTPSYMGGAFGIIGGLLLGEFAIRVGFFVPETIFYMSVAVVSAYCIPSEDLTAAVRMFRLFMLIATGLLGIYGYIGSLAVILILLFTTKTMDRKRPYLWPLIPFRAKALSNLMFRKKVTKASANQEKIS